MTVPFLDLVTPHIELEEEIISVVRSALHTGRFVGGPEVEGFEKEFAEFCRTSECIAVSSGTDALRFAPMAAGIGKGDLVVTVPNTFIATTEAISQSGATFDFVDIDERTYNMDPELLRKYLETHTGVKAVVPVHLYGEMADMDPILDLAEKYKLVVIEDACQAHGAEYFSRKYQKWFLAGSMGRAAAFSSIPARTSAPAAKAGAVTTNDPDIATKIRMLRDHGQSRKYYHEVEGYNGRLDAIQCGILRVKIRHLEAWNAQRRAAADLYREFLSGVVVPFEPAWSRAVYHLYVVRVASRDRLQAHLTSAGIGTALHYPVPLHQQTAYATSALYTFPIAEKVAKEILSLPMFPQLTLAQQRETATALQTALKSTQTAALRAKN